MTIHQTFDRKAKSTRSAFIRAKKNERSYATRLRKLARHIGDIVDGFDLSDLYRASSAIRAALDRYAEIIKPWAEAVAARMVAEVAQSDRNAWMKVSQEMGASLRKEIDTAPTGQVLKRLQQEQVDLITSLPREAGERVQKLAAEGLSTGRRSSEIVEEIRASGQVSKSRATLIARTETAKASSLLVQTRARHLGSTGYVWRTAGDGDVRKSHREMSGKFVEWDKPPTLSDGTVTHAGQIYNCRCFAEPVLPNSE